MPEQLAKMPRSASPVARSGAGDISERELSRERYNLQTTPARIQPAHPKKQLFSAPVNKFTATTSIPSPNLARIRSCLDEFRSRTTPARLVKMAPKAVSMEDLTPTKRSKRERNDKELPVVRSPSAGGLAEEQAAARVSRFMLVAAWRRRREEVRCLRKTLEFQVSCSERLRLQVCALKSLLDSDNTKVRLAIKELERLKQLVRDKEMEKAVLEREKRALEGDVSASEDRASEMSIGYRNARNELEGARAAAARLHHALGAEQAAAGEARAQRDHAYGRLSVLENQLAQHEELLTNAEEEMAALRREADEKQRILHDTSEMLKLEQEARSQCVRKCAELCVRVGTAGAESSVLRDSEQLLRAELARLHRQLRATQQQLDWWPRPLTRMLGVARSWLRYPKSMPEAIIWTLVPARYGC